MQVSVLSYPGFRLFWIGSLFHYLAQWVQQVALGWVAYDLTRSGAMLGLILGLRALPAFALAPIAGVANDRYNRRNLLVLNQLVTAAATLALAGALAAGIASPAHLIAYALATGTTGIFERNARHAMVLDLVPRNQVVQAIALNNVTLSGMRVISPLVSGFLLVWVGAAGNFLLQCLCYAGVAASLFWITLPPRGPRGAESGWENLKEGVRYTVRTPAIRILFLTGLVPYLILIPTWSTLLPVFAHDVFDAGPQGLGLLLSAVGVGGVLGGLAAAPLSRFDRLGRIQLGAMLLFALALVAVGTSPSLAFALPWIVLAGIGEMIGLTANQTLMQVAAPAALRGRVTSLIAMNPSFISLGSMLVGGGAQLLGAPGITVVLAASGVAFCALLYFGAPGLREMRLSHYRQEPERA